MQDRVASYPVSQQVLSIGHESVGLLGEFAPFDFNEIADFWGDIRFYPQEMPNAAVPPPQRHEWIEGSTSSTTTGDITSTTVSVESERPLEHHNHRMPACAETSAGERKSVECPSEPLTQNQTSVSDASLPLSLNTERGSLGRIMSPFHQQCASRKSGFHRGFHSQKLVGDRAVDSAAVDQFTDTASKNLGSRQHNFVHQELCLSMSTSLDIKIDPRAGESGIRCEDQLPSTSENEHRLKLKQTSLAKQAPRKYQKRQIIIQGNDVGHDKTVSVPQQLPQQLDHVERERRRRDHMSAKIAALERLLPKSCKRDRVSIVYDTIQLLKKLERDVQDLQQRYHEAKLRRASHKQSKALRRGSKAKSIDGMDTTESYFSNGIIINRIGTHIKPVTIRSQPSRGICRKLGPTHVSFMNQSSGGSNGEYEKRNVFVEFQVHLYDTVTAGHELKNFKSICRMDYLSRMVGVLEEFQLDLTTCNITRLSGYFICIVGLRARTSAELINATQLAIRLQSAVDVDGVTLPGRASLIGTKTSKERQK